jgi:hypothetical protein
MPEEWNKHQRKWGKEQIKTIREMAKLELTA